MKSINVTMLDHKQLNEELRHAHTDCSLFGCTGQRFIAAGMSENTVTIDGGVPGNALGAYLNGANIYVNGNAQDAVGDTMNSGEIIINGSVGDAVGYAMRGGSIYIKNNAGYRAGIHMKEYKEKIPSIVIGGCAGSFLGEYQAGGIIVVLGLNIGEHNIVSNFPATGMHGGKMFLRSDCKNIKFPGQVRTAHATDEDLAEMAPYIKKYCSYFDADYDMIISSEFTVVTPNSSNPYKQMYVAN